MDFLGLKKNMMAIKSIKQFDAKKKWNKKVYVLLRFFSFCLIENY